MNNILFTANDEYIKEVYDILSKDIKIVRKQNVILIVNKDRKVISKIFTNEYGTITKLKLPRKYGYLNNYILSKFIGLVYKNDKNC